MIRLALFAAWLAALVLAAPAGATIWRPDGAGARGAAVAGSALIERPSDGGDFAYSATEAPPFSGARAVVHFVATGPDAPPLDDQDASGVPDYVEDAGAAADAALAFYSSRGYEPPLSDAAGSDERPDIYLKHLGQGLYGLAVPPSYAAGGGFVLVASGLDRSQTEAKGSLAATVAHELFHLVQFSYAPDGKLPRWAAEGSASTMELLVFPRIQDLVTIEQLDRWLREPWRALYDERFACERCYGSAWWWYLLFQEDEALLPDYFGRLYGYRKRGVPLGRGLQPLDEVLRSHGYGSLYDAFTFFSVNLYRARLSPTPLYALRATPRLETSRIRRVLGLSMHYIPVSVPRDAQGLAIGVAAGAGPKPDVALIAGGPKGRRIKGEPLEGGRGTLFTVTFRNARERRSVVLIVTSGRKIGVSYAVVSQTV